MRRRTDMTQLQHSCKMLTTMRSSFRRTVTLRRSDSSSSHNLFNDDNYKSVLFRLNNGYRINMHLLNCLEDYYGLEQTRANNLTSFSKKWKSKFDQQSQMVAYRTTKAIQLKSIEISDRLVPEINARCKAIQTVINEFIRQTNQIYPRRSSGKTPKHRKADEIRHAYETAYAFVKKEMEKVERLQKEQKQAENALLEAKILLEKLQFDPTASPKKSDHAKFKVNDKQIDCDDIQRRLSQAIIDLDEVKAIYSVKATILFEQCQQLEEERLNLIRKTLIEFLEAIQSSETATQLNSIYNDIILVIKDEHKVQADLQEWARCHGIDRTPMTKMMPRTPAITEMIPFFQ